MNVRRLLFTSFFDNVHRIIAASAVPIAVTEVKPDWFAGLEYNKFVPSKSIVEEYKNNGNNVNTYKQRYESEVLSKLNPKSVAEELCDLADRCTTSNAPIVLLTYAESVDFCYRRLISTWFEKAGIKCYEWEIF